MKTLVTLVTRLRINRNIVECKYARRGAKKILVSRINRNIVECKFD